MKSSTLDSSNDLNLHLEQGRLLHQYAYSAELEREFSDSAQRVTTSHGQIPNLLNDLNLNYKRVKPR